MSRHVQQQFRASKPYNTDPKVFLLDFYASSVLPGEQ